MDHGCISHTRESQNSAACGGVARVVLVSVRNDSCLIVWFKLYIGEWLSCLLSQTAAK